MNESERHRLSDWMDDRIEAYLDGDLSDEERIRFEALLQGDEEARRQLRLAGLLRERLTELDPPACPPDIADNVLAQIRAELDAAAPGSAVDFGRAINAPDRTVASPGRMHRANDRIPSSHADHTENHVPRRRADRPAGSRPVRLRRLAWPALAATLVAAAITAVLLTGRAPIGPDGNGPIVIAEREPVSDPAAPDADPARDANPGTEQVDPAATTAEPPERGGESSPNAADPLDTPLPDRQLAAVDETEPDAAPAGTPDLQPSSPEVQQALAEAKWTLAYISQIGRQTGRTIRRDVLHDGITEPVQEVLGTTLNVDSSS